RFRARHHLHGALGRERGCAQDGGVPQPDARAPGARSRRSAGVPRALARESRAHPGTLARHRVPRDARTRRDLKARRFRGMARRVDLCDIDMHGTRHILKRPMNDVTPAPALTQREVLLHALYEAAELEHNLMCTYLYAAASLKDGEREGLGVEEAATVRRWRQVLLGVAIEEMGHLVAVWNITSGLGGSPRFGRTNFPLDPGYLPASVVVKLAPFNADTLQHFVFLERPHGSTEPEGSGFAYERSYVRGGTSGARLTPMGVNYDTVGDFYAALGEGLRALVAHSGEANAFDGDRALQLS